jgi:hypothetical protein
MSGYACFICPICGKEWRGSCKKNTLFVFSRCFCEETNQEHQKGLDRFGINAIYAR